MVEITYLLMLQLAVWTFGHWPGQGCYSCGGGVSDPSLLRPDYSWRSGDGAIRTI